ncbi:hypothetical protein [Nonlabens sp.]|uniref:hypothetical protein n=1 Tax=Nonlabens sp. TaxID=1888209 RepID=UPI003266CF51
MDYEILKKSLKMVAEFAQNSHSIDTVSEFMVIHERNQTMLQDHIEVENDNFVQELLESLPKVSAIEVKEFIEHDRGLTTNKRGGLYTLIKLFMNNGKEDIEVLKEKFDFIANRNNTIIMILNNSGF